MERRIVVSNAAWMAVPVIALVTAGAAPNSVEYSAGATVGTTTSTSTSYKNSVSYKDKTNVGFLGTNGSITWTVSNDWGTTDSSAKDVSGSVVDTWRVTGPNSLDG